MNIIYVIGSLAIIVIFSIFSNTFTGNTISTLCCAAVAGQLMKDKSKWALCAGLLLSIFGDACMKETINSRAFFIIGVLFFLAAHLCFCRYFYLHFGNRPLFFGSLTVLLIGYIYYFAMYIYPAIGFGKLFLPVLLYILVSVLSVSLAFAVNYGIIAKVATIVGVCLIAFSDTLIAQNSWVAPTPLEKLIIPAYLLCHLFLVAGALMHKENLFPDVIKQ